VLLIAPAPVPSAVAARIAGETPLPETPTVWALTLPLSMTVTAPGKLRTPLGVNVIVTEQLPPPGTLAPQLFVSLYAPLATMLVMAIDGAPTALDATAEIASKSPKSSLEKVVI